MATVLVPNCALAEVRFSALGQECESTLWFEQTAEPINEDNLQRLADYLAAWDGSSRMPLMPLSYVHREVYVKGRDIEDGFEATSIDAQGSTGALDQPAMPNNVSLSVSFRTGRTGRSRRGRNFWPCFAEAQVVANEVAAGTLAAIQAAYADLVGTTADGWRWVVVSLRQNNLPREVGLSTPITSVSIVDDVIDSMRRRLPGRGQ